MLPQISTDGITATMSWVSLKDQDIKGLKEDNLKLNQEAKSLQKAKENLQQTVDKQKSKLSGKLQLKGAKHTIWDQIITEVTNSRISQILWRIKEF